MYIIYIYIYIYTRIFGWCASRTALILQDVGTNYLVPDTWYQILGTKYLVPGAWYKVLDTRYLVRDCAQISSNVSVTNEVTVRHLDNI